MATVAPSSPSPSSPSDGSPGPVSPWALSPGALSPGAPSPGAQSPGAILSLALSPIAVSQAGNTVDSNTTTKERIVIPEAQGGGESGDGARRREPDQLVFQETKSDVLFACFIPIVLTLLGIGLVFFLSHRGGKAEAAGPERGFLICRMRTKDLWDDLVNLATIFCTHLILTPWGNDLDERDRSQQEFFKGAFNRTRIYLTVPPEDCARATMNDLSTRLKYLRLDGFEFYIKGNESTDDVKACFNLIDQFVSLKGPTAAILRSGPYGTLVKPNVLANVYQVHAPIDHAGQIPGALFVNNFDYAEQGHGGVDTVRMAQVLIRAQKERADSTAAGAPNVTNICYSLSFMGMRMDTRTMVKYSQVCETVQCCLVDKSPQRNDRSRSLVAAVMNRSLYNLSYDDANTLADKANAVSVLTRGALCIAADDVQADDFGGKCSSSGGRKAPLLTTVAELARSQNGAFVNDAGGIDAKSVVASSADAAIATPKFELPADILL